MRLATVRPPGSRDGVAALVVDGLAVLYPRNWSVRRLLSLAWEDRPPPTKAAFPLSEVELLAPIPLPGAIFCIGLNYFDHAMETGLVPPSSPLVFLKPSRASTPPGGPVRRPAVSDFVDYEGELVVVIGAGGEVGGFAIANDVSARDLQFSEQQWARGKGADTFCPWGPWITTVDEVPDPHELNLRTYINGELRQEAVTRDMIFRIPQLIAHISETNRLEPGDLILTGTPAGVGWAREPQVALAAGDVVRIEIDLLGAIEHPVR